MRLLYYFISAVSFLIPATFGVDLHGVLRYKVLRCSCFHNAKIRIATKARRHKAENKTILLVEPLIEIITGIKPRLHILVIVSDKPITPNT